VQISQYSRSYDVSYIFKMAFFRHFEFWKIQSLDKFSRAESKSASAHQIWPKSDDRRPRYCDKTEIQYGRRRHVEFTSGFLFDIFLRLWIHDVSAYQIWCKSDHIWQSYNLWYIFKMAAAEVTLHNYLQFWTTHEVDEVVRTCCSNLTSESWLLLDISQF